MSVVDDDEVPAVVAYSEDGQRAFVFHPRMNGENARNCIQRLRLRGFDVQIGKGNPPKDLVALRDNRNKKRTP